MLRHTYISTASGPCGARIRTREVNVLIDCFGFWWKEASVSLSDFPSRLVAIFLVKSWWDGSDRVGSAGVRCRGSASGVNYPGEYGSDRETGGSC